MCLPPSLLYPMMRTSEPADSMVAADSDKGFAVVEDAFDRRRRMDLLIQMTQMMNGLQNNRSGLRQTTLNRGTNQPLSNLSAQQQQPGLSQQQVQNPGSGSLGP